MKIFFYYYGMPNRIADQKRIGRKARILLVSELPGYKHCVAVPEFFLHRFRIIYNNVSLPMPQIIRPRIGGLHFTGSGIYILEELNPGTLCSPVTGNVQRGSFNIIKMLLFLSFVPTVALSFYSQDFCVKTMTII